MTETNPNDLKGKKAKASIAAFAILVGVSVGLSGPIAVNIHEAAHVLCAVKGECFGETRWLEGISALPVWNLLFGTLGASLFVLSALCHFYIFPKFILAFHDLASDAEKNIPTLAQLRKSSAICMLVSSILWVAMLITSISLYQGAI